MWLDDLKVVPTCLCSCCGFWLIFTIVAISTSFKGLDQGYYALTLGWVSQSIGDEPVTSPGVRFLGMGNMLVVYPATFQTMYFSNGIANACNDPETDVECFHVIRGPLTVRSRDGLAMTVSMSFQWRLQPSALKPLYGILADTLYKEAFVRLARASVVQTCSKFTADLFFTNRTMITEKMIQIFTTNFNHPERGLTVDIMDLQLRQVDVPTLFDAEIANTQEMMQEVEVAYAQRDQQIISLQRQVLLAQDQVEQNINLAIGDAEKTRVENVAVVQQILNRQRRQAIANAKILQSFGTDPDPFGKLFELMQVKAVLDHSTGSLVVNL